eukprot:g31905.t1
MMCPLSFSAQKGLAWETATERLRHTTSDIDTTSGCAPGWVDVLQPLQDIDTIWVFFFLFYVSFTYFAVLNVVTGVFCQSAIENAQKDHAAVVQNILDNKDRKNGQTAKRGAAEVWESHLKKIRALFFKLGADDTGVVTFDMLQEQFSTPAVREYFESLGLDVSDAWSFFKLLDVDGGGAVEIEEFLLESRKVPALCGGTAE